MTEREITKIGFKLTAEYDHDQFNTSRYKNKNLEVEFTYEKDKLITIDLRIEEINCLPITKEELTQLSKILNK